jgi:glycosyltransferase involved in cell wall biosynthesis
MTRHLRIAQVAPPMEPVPPPGYGGTERVVATLVDELLARGHDVTTFASADSAVAGHLVPTVVRALRPDGFRGDSSPWFYATIRAVLERAADFDVIHSHLEWGSAILALQSPVPTFSTFHGRLDLPWAATLLEGLPGLVAISNSQAATHPNVRWAGVVYNGLEFARAPMPGHRNDELVFVGRVAPEKGILDAIEVARLTGRTLKVIAKRPVVSHEVEYFEEVFVPALETAPFVEDLGELSGQERDRVVGASHAMLMPGTWPEPFGLAVIEALACGTPVLARRVGALPEILRDGIDGYFGDDVEHLAFLVDRVEELDRDAIRTSVIDRFSASRMTDAYEVLFQRAVDETQAAGAAGGPRRAPVAVGPGWEIPTSPPLPGLDDDDDVPQIGGSGGRSARIEPIPRRG